MSCRIVVSFAIGLVVCLALPLDASTTFWAQTTYVKGDVKVIPSDRSESHALKLGMILHRGDTVATGEGARASFLMHDGAIFTIGPSSKKTIGERKGMSKPSLAKVATNLTKTLLTREGDNPMLKHLGGLRAGERNIAMAPNQTAVTLGDLLFTWIQSPHVKRYTFTLMGPEDFFWEKTLTETTISVPGKMVTAGATYYWEIRDASIRNSFSALGSGTFTTLDSETAERVAGLTGTIDREMKNLKADDDFTPLFLKYQIYRENGMNLDALQILTRMIRLDPGNDLLLRWRSDVARLMNLEEDDLTALTGP